MVKLLGIFDIISALILMAQRFSWEIPLEMVIAIPIFLGVKAFLSLENIFSWIDVIVGITIIIGYFVQVPIIFLIILITIMLSKGLISVGC